MKYEDRGNGCSVKTAILGKESKKRLRGANCIKAYRTSHWRDRVEDQLKGSEEHLRSKYDMNVRRTEGHGVEP